MKHFFLDISLVHVLIGHQGTVWDICWHPNGKYLASCGTDKIIRIWADKNGKWLNIIGLDDAHTRTVRSIAWSPDGKLLASVGFDSTATIWEYSEDSFNAIASLEGHENEVKSCAFSPCGNYFATCGRDKNIWIWEIDEDNEFECSGVLNSHKQDVKKITWHPTKNILLSSSYDDTCMLHHFVDDDWETFETLIGHTSTVWSAKFKLTPTTYTSPAAAPSILSGESVPAPDLADDEIELDEISTSGQDKLMIDIIASVSADKTLKLWSNDFQSKQFTKTGHWRCLTTIENLHDRPIYDIDWHPHRDILATCGGDNSFTLVQFYFNALDSSLISMSHHDHDGNRELFIPSEVKNDQGIRLKGNDLQNQPPFSPVTGGNDLSSDIHGMYIVDDDSCKNIDLQTTEIPDGQQLPKLESYATLGYRVIKVKDAHKQDINAIKFHPTKPNILATASDDGLVKLWNLKFLTTFQ